MFLSVFLCLSVCLSVCEQHYSKMPAWIWMPEPDCFLRYHICCNAEFYYIGKIQRIAIGCTRSCSEPWFLKMVLFTASLWNTSVGGKCALPSAVLFLKQFRLGASTVSCSKLFHLLMTRFEKKYFIRVKSYKFRYHGHVINPYHNIITIKRE